MPERWLTYAEAGALLGMSPEAVRQRARRHDWPTRRTGNKPNDPNEVLVPDSVPVHPVGHLPVRPSGRPLDQPPGQPPGQPGDAATVADTMAALAAERRAMEAERDAALAAAAEARLEEQRQRERAARAEGERDGLREALRVAEDGRRGAGVERDAARGEAARFRSDALAERERANAALVRAVEAEQEAGKLRAEADAREAWSWADKLRWAFSRRRERP